MPTATSTRDPQDTAAAPIVLPDATPTPTPAPPAERIILYAPETVEPSLAAETEAALQRLAEQSGMMLELRTSLSSAELDQGMRLIVALYPASNISGLIQAAPSTHFLAIGIPGLNPEANLSIISNEGSRPDLIAFMAGYIGAVISPDWRFGMLGIADAENSSEIRQGFTSGGVYFCGLCRQVYPPFYDSQGVYIRYPLYIEVSEGASLLELQNAADYLIERSIKTIYLPSGANNEGLLTYLSDAGINIIADFPPPQGMRTNWVVTVRSSLEQTLTELVPAILTAEDEFLLPAPIILEHINPELFSIGRQRLAQEVMEDLITGYIAP